MNTKEIIDRIGLLPDVLRTRGRGNTIHDINRAADLLDEARAALSTLPIAVEGKVKPLEWRLSEEGWHIADTFFGGYRVERNPYDRWCWGVFFHGEVGVGLNSEDNFEAAKDAAQADFNERISSALAVQPAPDFGDLIIIGDTFYPVHSDVCRAFNELLAAPVPPSSPGKDGGQEVEAVAHIVERWDGRQRRVMLVEDYDPRDPDFWLDEEARKAHVVTPLYARPQPASTALVEAARDVITSASDTFKKRNGRLGSFEDDSGEKCWIVPFDAFEGLRSALSASQSTSREGESRG